MNLTSKRLLQFFAGCVGVCALSASAAPYYYVNDTFDETDVIFYAPGASGPVTPASSGMAIDHYKATLNTSAIIVAPTNWAAAAGDASKLTNVTVSFSTSVGARPLEGGTRVNVLNLETEGQTLTRNLASAVNFEGSPVYVDTMIKFTPSEDTPTISTGVKAAVFVNASSNLVVYHGAAPGGSPINTAITVPATINPDNWYRLTIMLGKFSAYTGFKVYINGTEITSNDGYTETGAQPGPWFFNADPDATLNSVAFQGTGMIDELVVTDQANGIYTPASVLLTLSFDSTITVLDGATPVLTGGTVAVGNTIHISTADWYELVSVVGADVTYSDSARLGVGNYIQTSSGTLAAGAATAVTITSAQFSGPMPGYGFDGRKVSTWAMHYGKTQQNMVDNASLWVDEYLLNVAPDSGNTELKITDIVIDPVLETATITVAGATTSVNFTQLNGALVVYTAATLAGGFTEAPALDFTVNPASGSAQVVVKYAAGSFIKAVVK